MLKRKWAVAACISFVSGAALADADVDIFGRPYVGQDGLQMYRTADPFDPLPQLWAPSRSDSGAPGASSAVFDATEFYYTADPLDPLPQFWARRIKASSPREEEADRRDADRDLFGRPMTHFSGVAAYYQADPFDPLPQIAALRRASSSAQAAAPAEGIDADESRIARSAAATRASD